MAIVLDLILVLLLLGYLVYGFRVGLFRSLGAIAGVAAGGVAAFFTIPLVSTWVAQPEWRTPAIIATVLVLILVGHTIGAAIGNAIGRHFDRGPLKVVERLLGGVASVIVAALVVAGISVSVGSLGIPVLSQAIASSSVLRTVDSLTPTPVKTFAAQIRSLVVEEGIPQLSQAIGGPTEAPTVPDVAIDSPAIGSRPPSPWCASPARHTPVARTRPAPAS